MNLTSIGKIIIIAAIGLLALGILFYALGALGVTKLPGDIIIKRNGTVIYIPLALMILLSIFLTLFINFYFYFLRR